MELTRNDRKKAQQEFNKGLLPGAIVVFVGVALNMFFGRASIIVPIVGMIIIVSGAILALVLGLKRRRRAIAGLSVQKAQ